MNKKRLLIDVTVLAQAVKTDVYRVTDELVQYLIAEKSLEILFTLSEEDFFQQQNVDLRAGLKTYSEESNTTVPFINARTDPAFANIDIYISTFFKVPNIWKNESRVKKISFAYDLVPELYPGIYEGITAEIISEFYNHLDDDWLIFSISESTKQDLIIYRPDLNPDNIVVMSNYIPVITGDTPKDTIGFANALRNIFSSKNSPKVSAKRTKDKSLLPSWKKCGKVIVNAINNIELDNTPFLSIITICHNAKYIRDTCHSIAEQSFQKFEWIVIDGGSNQETLKTFKKYKNHITVMVSEKDDGRYDAMNKGIALSKGKYLLFLNGGDYLYDQLVLEKIFSYSIPLNLISLFKLTLSSDIICGEVVTKETGMMPYPLWSTGPQEHNIGFFSGDSLPHQATFIQSELFQKIGLYDKNLKYAGDYEWFMRAIILHSIKTQYLPIVVTVYNFEGVSSSSTSADAPDAIELKNIYNHYLSVSEEKTKSAFATPIS